MSFPGEPPGRVIVGAVLRAFASGRLFGERSGPGPGSVLLLHGWRRTHRDFAAMVGEPLEAAGRPVGWLAVDLPGFGSSPEPPEPWGSDEYAALLEELLEDLEEPVVVVGHSFGGRVGLHLAARRPDAVRGLLLTGVPSLVRLGRPPRPALGFRAVRFAARAGLVPPSRLEAARSRYGSDDYRAAEGVMRAVLVRVLAERYENQLRALRCPVELVVGEADTAAPPAVAQAAAGLVERCAVTVLPGVGHLAPLEAPAALRAGVARLLA